jgi:asparagine synthetase B (glutamine-hydrolysing)
MPGLVGIVSTGDTKIDTCLMTAMRDAIRHRDWYKVDDYVDVNRTVSISRVHLNITNTKRQPYLGRSGRVKVFFHGDVYNDEAAGVDPSAFVYQLYEKEGPDFVSFLNGSFIVAIVDER